MMSVHLRVNAGPQEADLSCLALPVTGGDAIGDVIRVVMESVSPASKQDLIVAAVL
jgi:hypothetical protein